MKPLTKTDRQAYAIVEAALQTTPHAQAPQHFAVKVMGRIQVMPGRVVMPPKFQFPWLELLASMILAATMGIGWLVWRSLPPVYLEQLRVPELLLWRQVGLLGQDEMLAWMALAMMLVAVFLGGVVIVLSSRREWQSG